MKHEDIIQYLQVLGDKRSDEAHEILKVIKIIKEEYRE